MRDFAKVGPTFWVGETGRALRKLGRDTQLVALYLITAPDSNLTGVYHLALPTLAHHTGLPVKGASEGLPSPSRGVVEILRDLSEVGFAHYDPESETVWVVEMAARQLGDTLSTRDNRHVAVLRELEAHRKCRFYNDFRAKYGERFNLPAEAPSKPLPSAFGGTQEVLRSKEKEKEKENTPQPPAEPGGGVPAKAGRKKRATEVADSIPIPAALDTPAFAAVWSDWLAARRERGKAVTPRAARLQFQKLVPLGPERAAVCVEASIANDWVGIFPGREAELKPHKAAGSSPRPAVACRPLTPFESQHVRYSPTSGPERDADGKLILDQLCADLKCAYCMPRRVVA